jgi:anthranilate synthase component 1
VDIRAPVISKVSVDGSVLRSLAARSPDDYPVYFDSAAQGPLAQFSLLALAPTRSLTRDRQGKLQAQGVPLVPGGFLDNLQAWAAREASVPDAAQPHGLPFGGGWFVYLGYELAAEIEPRVALPPADLPFSAFAVRVTDFAVHDLATGAVYVVSEFDDQARHEALIECLLAEARQAVPVSSAPLSLASQTEDAPERFLAQVRTALEHIAAGDIYQANLSRAWRLRLARESDAARVYEALRFANPAPFAARVSWQGHSILSSSPERLLRITGREISTRPIAGTRPRLVSEQGGAEQDRRDIDELVQHPKERAEHIMLIDLERNDLGRVCEAGSVMVDEYMVTESYAHVHHIVSNVRGRLRAGATATDALRALFPGGTITGCPKVRCMQIIAALEGRGRGAYTGSLGWLGTNGDADFNILIRTLTQRGADIELRAGAGIVADSVPERELEETRAKARGMLRAFTP